MKHNTFEKYDASDYNFCIVRARFNEHVTKGLLDGALRGLEDSGAKKEHVLVYEVPGSYDIPYGVQVAAGGKHPFDWFDRLTTRGHRTVVDAIICLGAIIKGETSHDEHIARAVFGELLRLEHEYKLPIVLGIITTNTLEQAEARSDDDDKNVGRQAAKAAIELLALSRNNFSAEIS